MEPPKNEMKASAIRSVMHPRNLTKPRQLISLHSDQHVLHA